MSGRKPARIRCGECQFCLRDDCGTCYQCLQKKKFGGDGTSKQACLHRRCINLQNRSTATNSIIFNTTLIHKVAAAAATATTRSSGANTTELSSVPTTASTSRVRNSSARLWSTTGTSFHHANNNQQHHTNSVASMMTSSRDNHHHHHHHHPTATAAASPPLLLPVMACPFASCSTAKQPPATGTTTTTTTATLPSSPPSTTTTSTTAVAALKIKSPPPPPPITHMYGRPIPVLEKRNVCAGCGGARDDQAEDEPILLCDGKGCGCEFHLKCCIPPLQKVPTGTFYCFDCSPEGTTSQLRQYLQDHEEQRLQYPNASAFLQALLQLDLKDEQEEEEEEEGDDGERDDRNDEGDVKATNVTDAEPEEGVDDDDDDNQEDPSNKDTTLPPQNKNSNKKKKKARITKRKKSSTSSYSKNKKRKQSQPKPPKDRIPESELARVTAIHSLALGPLPKIKQQQQQQHGDEQQPRSSQDRVVVESSDHNNHNDESDDNTTNNTTTNDTRAATSQWLFIGKPVKLYCPLGNGYHNGRIVSARRRNLWSQLSNNDVDDGDDNDQGAAAAAATSSNAITEDDWVDEYLIRFHAGLDGRKTTLHWWVVLEEHSLAVATTLIWGDFGNKNGFKGYKPGRLWVRTTRELLPVRHLLREELGQVVFMETNKSSTATTISRASNSKKRTLCWGLAQSFGDFGDDGFKVLHLQNSATDLFSPHLATFMSPQHQQQPSKSPRNSRGGSKTTGEASIVTGSTTAAATSFHASLDGTTSSWRRVRELEYAQACAEREEQKRVYEWNQRRLENPAMEKALSCLDEQRLGALTFVPSKKREGAKNYKVTTIDVSRYHADLVPLIPRGLDRSFIMKFLERNCDMIGSKDVAASLSCEAVMSIPAALQSMRDKRREPERNETEVRELSN